jgi:hypothetical protein
MRRNHCGKETHSKDIYCSVDCFANDVIAVICALWDDQPHPRAQAIVDSWKKELEITNGRNESDIKHGEQK